MKSFAQFCICIIATVGFSTSVIAGETFRFAGYDLPVSLKKINTFHFGKYQIIPVCTGFISTKEKGKWQFPEVVFSWVICAPNDTLVIDAGMSIDMVDEDFFPWYLRPFIRHKYQFAVDERQEIDHALSKIGIRTRSVRYILLSHAHYDHIGRLDQFPYSKVLLSHKEHKDATKLFSLEKGYIPHRLPENIHYILKQKCQDMSFVAGCSNEILPGLYYVNTNGHTHGHLMFVLKSADRYVIFVGDDKVNEQAVYKGSFAHSIADFISQHDCILLGNHDNKAPEKLAEFCSAK